MPVMGIFNICINFLILFTAISLFNKSQPVILRIKQLRKNFSACRCCSSLPCVFSDAYMHHGSLLRVAKFYNASHMNKENQ